MSRKWLEWLQFLGMAAVAVLLLWLAFKGMDLKEIWKEVSKAHFGWIGLSMVLTLAGHLSRARRWQLLIQAAGYPTGLWPCFLAMMTGYFSNLGIPRVGEANRCISLNRLTKAPVLALAGTVVAERTVDLITFAALLLLTVLSMGMQAWDFFHGYLWQPVVAVINWKIVVAAVVAVLLLLLLNALAFGRKGAAEAGWRAKIRLWAMEIWNGLAGTFRLRGVRLVEFGLHSAGIWLSYYAAPLCTLLALAIPTDDVWSLAFYLFVLGSLSRTIPLPAGSAGAYHLIVSQWMVFVGHTLEQGVAVAVLNHAVQTLFYLVFGIVGLAGFFILLRIKAPGQSQPIANSTKPTP